MKLLQKTHHSSWHASQISGNSGKNLEFLSEQGKWFLFRKGSFTQINFNCQILGTCSRNEYQTDVIHHRRFYKEFRFLWWVKSVGRKDRKSMPRVRNAIKLGFVLSMLFPSILPAINRLCFFLFPHWNNRLSSHCPCSPEMPPPRKLSPTEVPEELLAYFFYSEYYLNLGFWPRMGGQCHPLRSILDVTWWGYC